MPNGALGHIDDFKKPDGQLDYERLAGCFVDGPTGYVFADQAAWESHISPISGTVPADPEYLRKTTTPNYDEIAAEALARGTP